MLFMKGKTFRAMPMDFNKVLQLEQSIGSS